MTLKQFQAKLYNAVLKAENILKGQAPVRSGLLKDSISVVATPNGYDIIVDTNKAPHMPYTEEKWISPQWGGRDNPNEAWFKKAIDLVFRLLRADLQASGRYVGSMR